MVFTIDALKSLYLYNCYTHVIILTMSSMYAGSDYEPPERRNNEGPDEFGNLRWRAATEEEQLQRTERFSNRRFMVTILDDDIPEPVEVVEVVVQCIPLENCYLPRTVYTVTIIDDQGECVRGCECKFQVETSKNMQQLFSM